MDFRPIAVAVLAVLLASCSSVYDTTEFMTARTRADQTDAGAKAEAGAAGGGGDKVATATQDEPTAQPAAVASNDASGKPAAEVEAPAAVASADEAATGKSTASEPKTEIAVAAAAAPAPVGGGLLSMFRAAPEPGPAAAATAAAIAPAAPGPGNAEPSTSSGEPPASAEATAAEADIEEVSEAELAGEVEADPDEVPVPEEPINDGLEHDFVNVYTSKPDHPEPMIANLPGVTWEGGLVLVSRTPDDDPSNFFDGPMHPFARTVPGIPQRVVQAANGLLLQHAAINVSCVKSNLLGLVRRAEAHFGKKVVVTSGYRSPAHNRRVRGARHSQHMFCNALDLYMPGVARDDLARYFFAQPDRGGIGLYCHTRSIHIDTGKRRQWRWSCGRRRG